jgi:voltage-gated potassium channel Kch
VGESVARLLTSNEIGSPGEEDLSRKYVAFDLDPNIVVSNYRSGKKVLYGDGSLPIVLETAGIENPRALVVTYADEHTRYGAVQRLREAFPTAPIITRATGEEERLSLLDAGASVVCCDERESSLRVAGILLSSVGFDNNEVSRLCREARSSSELQDLTMLEGNRAAKADDKGTFIASSASRFNIPDTRNNLANQFFGLTKSLFGSAATVNEEGDFDEPRYSLADTKLQLKEAAVPSPTIAALEAAGGVDGVDFCKLPVDAEAVGER